MSAPMAARRPGGQARGESARNEEARARQPSRLELLVTAEGALRELPSAQAVEIFAVNETRALLGFSQAFFMTLDSRGRARARAVSGLAVVDRNAPLIRTMEKLAGRMHARLREDATVARARLDEFPQEAEEAADWPFGAFQWCALRDRKGRAFGGLLLARKEDWEEADAVIGARLAGAIAHALMALTPPALLRRFAPPRWLYWALPAVLLALLLIPVPMMAIAPVEVIADDPFIVAAPMEGVIADVLKEPNTAVKAGETLFVYDDTDLKSKAEVAARREAVAAARLETLRKAAFSDARARQQLAEARAELALARARSEYARRKLAQVRVRAARDGMVIYSGRSKWIRKPVKTGERVMRIADPRKIALRISLPVRDAIAIRPGGKVRVFLDADPLDVIEARVRTAAFHAEEMPGGLLAYEVIADFTGKPGGAKGAKTGAGKRPRIGFRGSAQVSGGEVPLGFYLLRRPIAAIRQHFGI